MSEATLGAKNKAHPAISAWVEFAVGCDNFDAGSLS